MHLAPGGGSFHKIQGLQGLLCGIWPTTLDPGIQENIVGNRVIDHLVVLLEPIAEPQGMVNGILFAVVMGIVGVIWFGSPALGYVIAVAMVINLVVAGLAGTVIPVILDRIGVDPALASGAFVTTVTDVVGFFAFLGLAAAVLL